MASKPGIWMAAAATALLATPGAAAPPAPKDDAEAAAAEWVGPLEQRHVVRNGDGGLDVWLIGAAKFDDAVEAVRRALSAKKALQGGWRVDKWTYLEPDRSYLLDLSGSDMPLRMRLTRHLTGSLIELQQAGVAAEAPRWTPPFRPLPVLLLHGSAAR